jgi:predicted lipoprotein with Yx(FWY)xxD motif
MAGPRRCDAGGRGRDAGGRPAGRLGPGRVRARLPVLAACVACVACVGLAGCGSGHPAAASPVWEVQAGQVRGLGTILVDGHGFTLYIYQPDRQGRSVCTAVCAVQWPPLVLPRGVRGPVAGPGVNPAMLGTAPRAGGVLQVTYNRWPLYLWEADLAPGQATGQGEDMGAWYTLSPSGSVDRLPLP